MGTALQRSIRLESKAESYLSNTSGNRGEIFYDVANNALRVFDGHTLGGMVLGGTSNVIVGGATTQVQYNLNGILAGSTSMTLVDGRLTLLRDTTINGLTVGKGAGNVLTNTAVGVGTLRVNSTGGANTAAGYNALLTSTTGGANTAVGYNSGSAITTGSRNVILGGYTGATAPISKTGNNFVVLSDGAGNVRQYFNGANAVVNGTITATNLSGTNTGDLVSGSTIRTINGQSLLGSTDLELATASSTYSRVSYVASAGQSEFAANYTVGYLEVFLNGVLLPATEYTATNGITITLDTPASLNATVETIAYAVSAIQSPGSAGGATTQVQFNSNSGLAGSANLTFDGSRLTANTATFNGAVEFNGAVIVSAALSVDGELSATNLSGTNTGDLISGITIKTINGTNLLDSGDLVITAGGDTTQVQYNLDGEFTGSANMTFNGTTLTTVNDAVINGLTVGKGAGVGGNNTAVGYQALYSNASSGGNTAIGNNALRLATAGANTALGSSSGSAITSGSSNVIIGGYTGAAAPISATGSNFVVLSDGAGNVRQYFTGANATFNGTVTATNISGTNTGDQTAASIGLGNVNNTSDANKPVSTAQQTALNGKQAAGSYPTGSGTSSGTNTGDQTAAGLGVGTTSNSQFGSLGVGTAASTVSGEIRATNNITAYYSDDRFKTNLGNIPDALAKVLTLNGFYYEANELAQSYGYEKKLEVGVSAQQVQAVQPMVTAPAPIDDNYLTVRYERLVPLLIEAIKELTAKVTVLEKDINNRKSP